jgi:hypothetical protein
VAKALALASDQLINAVGEGPAQVIYLVIVIDVLDTVAQCAHKVLLQLIQAAPFLERLLLHEGSDP